MPKPKAERNGSVGTWSGVWRKGDETAEENRDPVEPVGIRAAGEGFGVESLGLQLASPGWRPSTSVWQGWGGGGGPSHKAWVRW